MKFRTFKYHLSQGIKGMVKNGFMSLAAIATVIACSFILILSLCICFNIDYMLEQIEETIGITVFLGPDVSDEMTEEIGESIRAIDHVTEVVYKSADDNLTDAMNSWENSSILEGLRDDNPIPASYEISLDGAEYQADVVKALEMLQVSVEAELNGVVEEDEIERVYLDENGNEITRKQAEELGIVEPETTEAQTAAEATTAPSSEAATETVTSGAQADLEAGAENAEASVTEAATTAPQTEAQTQAETAAAAEATTEAAETTTYSSAPSQELLDTMNSAVAATAGGNVMLDSSSETGSESADGGVAGTEQYDASQYGIGDYEYKGIEKIRHATEEAAALVKINTAVRIFSLIVVAVLCVISISIIMNTIRLTVVIRKNEINIMKYVGATDWFIRWPFVIEGMLIGFIGSVIPTLICFFGYTEGIHLISEKLPFIVNIVEFKGVIDIFMYIAPITIIFGMLLGIIGSVSSMRKYLRV